MTDDGDADPAAPSGDGEIPDAVLGAAADLLAQYVDEGVRGPGSGTGISPRDLELVADGPVVAARLDGTTLCEHSFRPESWEDPDRPAPDARAVAEALYREAGDDLRGRLVEAERTRLADLVAAEAEQRVRAALAAARPGRDWDLSADVVERPADYRHGDPDWVHERGYPAFGLEVQCWDPDERVVVEIAYEPPDVDRLVDAAVERLLEATDGA